MADVWANSMACHPTATCHIAGCCRLVNSLSRFQSHMPHCREINDEINVAILPHCGCKNSIRHIENRFSPYFIYFLMQFRLWRAAAFVSSPIYLLISLRINNWWLCIFTYLWPTLTVTSATRRLTSENEEWLVTWLTFRELFWLKHRLNIWW